MGYDEIHSGYFITHDIYEEWALAKIVSRCFSNYSNTKQFFDELGESLPIRRAFRLWVSEHLANGSNEIESFIQGAFKSDEISQFWKDEILISVLLSDYSGMFFNLFENEIIENDFAILKRILFLLRIACTDISSFESIDVIEPKGKGWEEVISLVYKYKSDFFDSNLNLVLPVLTDWCNFRKSGKSTRNSGLLALSVIQKTETEKGFYIRNNAEEKILKVVFNSSREIVSELKEIFGKVIANKWTNHNAPYEGLCSKILEKPYLATELIKQLPLYVIKLCDLLWQKRERREDDFGYNNGSMESKYGLADEFRRNYFPASANQTPVKWLLQVAFHPTLDFIINFTNRAVETYSQSDYGKEDVEKITLYIGEIEVTQYFSWSLWGMYRGNGSPVVPDLLQSIHMALEKTLLDYAPATKSEILERVLLKILRESKSASLTSIVCSVVLANRDKLYNVALVLFKTIELFHIDTVRSTSEFQAKSNYGIGYGMDKLKDVLYTDERLKTCDDEHRSSNLESLFLSYQLSGINGFAEEQNIQFIEKLYEIIDQHKSNDLPNKLSEILLLRMDRRNLTPKISETDDNKFLIEFTPKIFPEDLKSVSEQARSEFDDFFKYSALKTWSDFLIGRESQGKIAKHDEYDNNPIIALSETRQLVEEIKSGDTARGRDHSIPPFTCSKMLIEYKDKLQKEDIDFCKEIITSTLSRLFSDEYNYQISDGVEASFHAIPILINEYPEDVENIVSMMVLALFDETPLGAYKRICDYVIESIHKSKLWEQNQKVAQSILFGYIKLKPIYKKIIDGKRKEQRYWRRIPKSSILEELDKAIPDFNFEENSFDIKDIELLDVHGLGIVYQLIPSDTKDNIHLDIVIQTLTILASRLLIDRRVYEEKFGDDHDIFKVRLGIFKRYANFILQREVSEIDKYLTPFLDFLSPTEETSLFIGEIITAEDSLMNREQFWYIWNKLFPKIKELCDYPRSPYLKQVIINYLLAWQFWKDRIEEWHSLSRENLSLYVNASKEMGHIPAVLYSVTRVLNTVGSNFKNEGIDWVYTIVSNNRLLQLGDFESNTLYYLETYLRKFIFNNRQEIKKEIRLKNKVIPILEFMIERGSVHAYLLRESIL
ncbi:ATP-binding protein [Sphingobacterium sp. FBM7-1]|uniref:ATP-binding protein n=1 Tax=Sphingobacterium sp. FBM7-1 TaxID=2886688 RepID=UPI001D128B90|nr:ATP-binding protein [Sphingobacterium sp. FBM7-1]MCC2600505.1 ATP-binding protein [Sphingobacterium sp. FBM7-1]